ncbi:MAG: ornithine carbamoyltransferase [Phycisphaerae bacterium]|nr:ornithine carbamoyltransferase [Phycisphaerae bacterium]
MKRTLGFKDYLTAAELTPAEVTSLFASTTALKKEPGAFRSVLAGRSVVMLFEKPSLRTRVTFEIGIARLGGHALFYDHSRERIGERESVHDYAKNLERWCDAIVARTFSHEVVEGLARHARVPVVNALSDDFHPCQALADVFSLRERLGGLKGKRLVFVGDGNNVCASLMILAATVGMDVVIVGPEGYGPDESVLRLARSKATISGGSVSLSHDPSAVRGAAAVYTDAWTSMGWESEAQERRRVFGPYQVNADLMARASDSALFMHCLPAHRGEEVTDEVIDSPRSIVFDQAENRMHAQNALLLGLMGSG